ncbi:hypothetical protein ABBQ38_000180 [Trebouxia sp. C0009 RCD-2024]
MQSASGSYRNLAALADGFGSEALTEGGPLSFGDNRRKPSRISIDSQEGRNGNSRFIFVSNHLPIRCNKSADGNTWDFAWDDDALIAQAKGGIDEEEHEVLYVGCLSVEIDPNEQEMVALELYSTFNCFPVFLGASLKERYYRGFCKQQLWPMLHYWLPLSPSSASRFDPDLWQAYVKANKIFSDKLVEVISMDDDFVWIHDYHLLVLPSLLRKRFHRLRCGLFLHSPFPSSEIWRTFPKREELLRSLLNVDLIGFHTFDYARHFLSCCSRMLGLEHVTSRGSIMIEYYGRDIGVKIMPTGVNPDRFLEGFTWDDTLWRRGELLTQFQGQTVLVGVDDMDLFKGIELKLMAVERVLDHHPEWRGKLVLIQVTNAPRSSSKDITELHAFVLSLVERINKKFSSGSYKPIVWVERPVSLYEKIALYSIADVAVVTATRDGMNLVPYEYIVCRQGAPDISAEQKASMLVISEFVGCSPSLSGAIRVNPWNVDSVADGIYAAIKMPLADRHLRHVKHWRYVSAHTAAFWVKSFVSDLQRLTKRHNLMKCYGLGLGLDTFRIVSLGENFRRLDPSSVLNAYSGASKRLLLLDYDGTLVDQNAIDNKPDAEVLKMVQGLCADPNNFVFIISGRARSELSQWFDPSVKVAVPSQETLQPSPSQQPGAHDPPAPSPSGSGQTVPGQAPAPASPPPSTSQESSHNPLERLGLAAEHGYFLRFEASQTWQNQSGGHADLGWKDMVIPILQVYTESTDGSYLDVKESALVWHYKDADPDFGRWQAKELLDHLEGMLSNEAVVVTVGQAIVEVKPQGASKGNAVDRILKKLADEGNAPDFVLCIGDDRSDEDMFTAMEHVTFSPHLPAEVFACTVGQKPSKAPFYMNDTADVASLLARLSEMHQHRSAARLKPSGKGMRRV